MLTLARRVIMEVYSGQGGCSGSWKVELRRLSGETLSRVPGDFPLRGDLPALARSLSGSGAESFRLWRGDLSVSGALSAHRTANAPCCEKSPR